jgi:outer membrane receptor for ferrienterochelin and colicins
MTAAGLLLAVAPLHAQEETGKPLKPSTSEAENDVVELDQIVVTGGRVEQRLSDAPVATEVISREEIERSGAEDLGEILEEHPGIQVSRDSFRGQSLSMQGLDRNRVLILVDGERILGGQSNTTDLTRFQAEDIDHIEIVKGPSSALYGSDAMGGVVNIITRKANKPVEARLRASYGERHTVDLSGHVGLSSERWNTRLSGGWHRGEAYDLDDSTLATDGSAYSDVHVGNMTRFLAADDVTLLAGADYTIRNETAIDENANGAVFDRERLMETFNARLGSEMRFGGVNKFAMTGHFTLHRYQEFSDQRGGNALDRYEETIERRNSGTMQYDRLFYGTHLWTLGVQGFHQRFEAERLEAGVGDRAAVAPYSQDEWTIIDDPVLLVVVPGIRVDIDSEYGVHPSPKVSLRFDPHEAILIRAGWGLGFRAPNFEELLLNFNNTNVGYRVEGNLDLEPEESMSINAGVELRPHKRVWANASFFRNDLDQLITIESLPRVQPTDPQVFRYTNVAEAWTMGGEAALRVMPVTGLSLEGSYTVTFSEDVTLGRPLEGVAPMRGTFGARYSVTAVEEWVGLNAMIRGQLMGTRPFYDDANGDGVDERTDADPYVTLDARIGADFIDDHLGVFVGVDNIVDEGLPSSSPH